MDPKYIHKIKQNSTIRGTIFDSFRFPISEFSPTNTRFKENNKTIKIRCKIFINTSNNFWKFRILRAHTHTKLKWNTCIGPTVCAGEVNFIFRWKIFYNARTVQLNDRIEYFVQKNWKAWFGLLSNGHMPCTLHIVTLFESQQFHEPTVNFICVHWYSLFNLCHNVGWWN